MIVDLVTFRVKKGKEQDFEQHVEEWGRQMRRSRGFISHVLLRNPEDPGEYFAQVRWMVNGAINLDLVRIAGGVQTSLSSVTVAGLTATAGDVLRLRLQASGTSPTTLRAKVWKAALNEPPNWQLTTTDAASGLQVPGSVGVRSYLSGTATNAPVTVAYDNLLASRLG